MDTSRQEDVVGARCLETSHKAVLRNLAGSATSPDDDRAQHTPVRLAGVEQRSDPVVLEVAEPEADPFDALDQVVERFGRTVRDPGQVEVGDLFEPGLQRASELL